MSDYTFKNLNEIDTKEEVADGTTVMGFENGVPIQMPMSAVKGSGGVFVIDSTSAEYSETDAAYGDKIKNALLAGNTVWYYNGTSYYSVVKFNFSTGSWPMLTIYYGEAVWDSENSRFLLIGDSLSLRVSSIE